MMKALAAKTTRELTHLRAAIERELSARLRAAPDDGPMPIPEGTPPASPDPRPEGETPPKPPGHVEYRARMYTPFRAAHAIGFCVERREDAPSGPAIEPLLGSQIAVGRQVMRDDRGRLIVQFSDEGRRLILWLDFADADKLGAILTSHCIAEVLRCEREQAAMLKAMEEAGLLDDDDEDDDEDDDDEGED